MAPEVIRYTSFSDFVEEKALELLYVKKGVHGADFSIGLFQMKPSFIERLEYEINRSNLHVEFSLPLSTPLLQRRARLERMKLAEWQVYYAYAYWNLCKEKFKHRTFGSAQERVAFYGAAYNFGFYKDERLIESWKECQYFPYGKKFKGEQTSYADLAISIYDQCIWIRTNNP